MSKWLALNVVLAVALVGLSVYLAWFNPPPHPVWSNKARLELLIDPCREPYQAITYYCKCRAHWIEEHMTIGEWFETNLEAQADQFAIQDPEDAEEMLDLCILD